MMIPEPQFPDPIILTFLLVIGFWLFRDDAVDIVDNVDDVDDNFVIGEFGCFMTSDVWIGEFGWDIEL